MILLAWPVLFLILVAGTNSIQPPYTQDVVKFRSQEYNARMQLFTGCWIYSKTYLESHPQVTQQLSGHSFQKIEVSIVKKCLRNIKRKDAINKMISLIDPEKAVSHRSLLEIIGSFGQEDITNEQTEFDSMLMGLLKKHRQDFLELQKKGIKNQVDRRRGKKKLFGLWEVGPNTPTIIMVAVSALVVTLFSCYKYYGKKRQLQQNRIKKRRQMRQE